jgi:hypothetical protein
MAEASTSDWVTTLTLTYEDCDEREADQAHKIIYPPHFQAFIRSLRDANHKIRYLVVGEYGDLKGRAHFHCILFGNGKELKLPKRKNTHTKYWPHGYVYADPSFSEENIRYVVKYMLPWDGQEKSWFSISKKPTIGSAYFSKLAKHLISHGRLPTTFEYVPPATTKKKIYLLSGATRKAYLTEIIEGLKKEGSFNRKEMSEWVEKSFDKYERAELEQIWKELPVAEQWGLLEEGYDQERLTEKQATSAVLRTERDLSNVEAWE